MPIGLVYPSSKLEGDSMPDIRKAFVRALAILITAAVMFSALMPSVFAQARIEQSAYSGLRWRMIGPFRGGRVNAVSGVPGQPTVFYFGSVGGGVWKPINSGRTWTPVFDSQPVASIGAIGVAPSDPNIVYVGTGDADMRSHISYVNGIFKSTDGGNTWQPLTVGIPTEGLGHIGITVAPTNNKRVYAIVDAKAGGLYRSDDAGATWTLISDDKRIWGRGWYFCKIAVDPKNAEIVYVSNTSLYRSVNAGKNWTAIKGAPGGDDYHQLWIYPDDPNRMILGSDQGAIVTEDGAQTWSSWYNQPTAQLYHVAADKRFPYWVTGAQQDSGSIGTPTRGNLAELSEHDWRPVCAGGESDYTAPDPLHPEILFGGRVTRCNVVTGEIKDVSPERALPAGVTARHT